MGSERKAEYPSGPSRSGPRTKELLEDVTNLSTTAVQTMVPRGLSAREISPARQRLLASSLRLAGENHLVFIDGSVPWHEIDTHTSDPDVRLQRAELRPSGEGAAGFSASCGRGRLS